MRGGVINPEISGDISGRQAAAGHRHPANTGTFNTDKKTFIGV